MRDKERWSEGERERCIFISIFFTVSFTDI